MSNIPTDLRYSKTHEWIRVEEDGVITLGITDVAQQLLGDLVFVELPEVGTELSANDEVGVVESVKAASDVYIPVSGEIISVNSALSAKPELINLDPYGEGWICRVQLSDPSEVEDLLEADDYVEIVAAEDH